MKKIITKPATSNCMSDAALANTMAIRPAQMNAHTDVILRPNLSSAYIMNKLAHGTASVMPKV
jgi:hypothetical protein